jgi:hypothetical protein
VSTGRVAQNGQRWNSKDRCLFARGLRLIEAQVRWLLALRAAVLRLAVRGLRPLRGKRSGNFWGLAKLGNFCVREQRGLQR